MSGNNAPAGDFTAALYEKLPFPVLVLDDEARLLSRNAAAARAFGWTADPDGPVLDGETEGLLARYAADRAGAAHALRFARADGTVFETVAQVLALGTDGAPYALLFGDWPRAEFKALRRVETELEEKRREYFSLLQILPDMIIRFDDKLTIRFINDKYAERFGMTSEQVTGMTLWSLARTPAQRQALENVLDSSPDMPVRTREHRYEAADGSEHWVLWTSVATYQNGKVAEVVAVGRDITEVKQQHQKLEAQALELKKKNEALDQFTATVSHDLKAPLRHLSMFSEMIAEDVRAGRVEDLPDYAGQLRKGAARMRRIIDSLLEYAQIAWHIADLQPVSLAEVVRDALVLLEGHVAESAAEIDVGALPEVMGDAELLRRLVQNLIGNAVKYRRPGMPPRVRVYGQAEGSRIRFVVEDEGIGIEPRHAERVFEIFYRLHRDETVYEGTGVGLALARRIAESHDGTIVVDADYAPGVRFVVTFPRAAAR